MESPARSLRLPKGNAPTTMPLSATEMRILVVAAEAASQRDVAFLLLMRYFCLAIQDATTLS